MPFIFSEKLCSLCSLIKCLSRLMSLEFDGSISIIWSLKLSLPEWLLRRYLISILSKITSSKVWQVIRYMHYAWCSVEYSDIFTILRTCYTQLFFELLVPFRLVSNKAMFHQQLQLHKNAMRRLQIWQARSLRFWGTQRDTNIFVFRFS